VEVSLLQKQRSAKKTLDGDEEEPDDIENHHFLGVEEGNQRESGPTDERRPEPLYDSSRYLGELRGPQRSAKRTVL